MSDNEYERFEITDYDLANEFNINRPRRRQTKNQQIYGIWADDSDDNEETNASETGRHGRRRGRAGVGGGAGTAAKDYTAPVNFVAGGIQQAGKKKPKEEERADDEEEEDGKDSNSDDEADARPSFGRKMLGAESPHSSEEESSAEEDERGKHQGMQKQRASNSGFQHKSHISSGRNVGAWEQHTRGIGAKLLLQMGYKPGMGLGKDLQGISQPVEAHVRKGRGAIGCYGPEKAASVGGVPAAKAKVDEDVREAKESKEKLNKWKKTGDVRQTKAKRYYYKSVEEVIEKGKSSNHLLSDRISKKLGNVPVIDMTGPERRVLSGYHALGQSKVVDEELYVPDAISVGGKKSTAGGSTTTAFALPELMHNLQLIVDRCEQEIIALDKTEREASDRQASLEHERKNLTEIVNLEKDHIDTLERALQLVEKLTDGDDDLDLENAEKIFLELQDQYAAEYKEFALGDLAAGVVAPLVRNALLDWQPLLQPSRHVSMVKRWHGILQAANDEANALHIFEPYSALVWAGVVPSFRACAANWNPKQHQSMATLLDIWAPLLPPWILDSVLEQLVLPRLCAGVRDWDPLTDTVPIHQWILPWHTILGHKMEEYIFPTIREKLGVALHGWLPQDRSARAMLTPWKTAFDAAHMQMFLIEHIIPKLQLVLNEFIINPLHQDLELWNQVWEWHELIPPLLMAQLLDKYFFPKWMQVLVLWLNQSPDYVEISRWYTGWKGMFSEELLREPNIKEHFLRSLEMMQRATEAVVNPPQTSMDLGMGSLGLPPPPLITTPPPPVPPSLLDLQISTPAQLEFKELVSQKCAELGVIFAPLPGRRELGKQVYRVGKFFCYIDRNVCMISDSSFNSWAPTSLAQMLERAVSGGV